MAVILCSTRAASLSDGSGCAFIYGSKYQRIPGLKRAFHGIIKRVVYIRIYNQVFTKNR